MLRTGTEYLESLRDGRVVYLGGERIEDVTTHPAFRNAARTIAEFYDAKADPARRDVMAYEEDGELFSMYYKRATSAGDLAARTRCHRELAELSYGFLGRSPDYIASFVTGMSILPGFFEERAENLTAFYEHMRKTDMYAAHAIVSPQGSRDASAYQQANYENPSCRVVAETDEGVIVSGMKMLATGGVLADEIWVGNILPLSPEAQAESITFSMPVATPGLSLWSRKSYEREAVSEFEAPMAARFDETDAMVLFENVLVPWERVFVHNDPMRSRGLYIQTPAHSYGNHHSNVRFAVKLQLLVGLASRVAQANGAHKVPAVAETLGRLAAMEALIDAVIAGQIQACEEWPVPGYVTYNRRMMYAGLNWGVESYSAIIDTVRTLCGGGVLQMPADGTIAQNPELFEKFRTYWHSPNGSALDRMKLFKLAWDLVGSEFAGRHQQYEKFFPGASFIVRGHSFREAPWDRFHAMVDGILDRMELPGPVAGVPEAAE
ncbi:hypothetical protein N8I71_07865 [Roseibacterium sp. SDUM158016]|uniref:4-hydroxyphenylacetate 3-hydroxylase family protein n=1 Tax=Roseicyclus sediminis TaxID=2980997 RepID=UPI0021D12C4A|nr:4-hydroxyphenylacetate 3-hydroxylase N-terminal domain-containing protein [Roseibacterium sp. SDUM158016]MCU4652744.1 hypothetical protein [Roseibacterium sp. SDUM158016]